MTHTPWPDAWGSALRTAIGDDALLLAGHNDFAAGGITNLTLSPGHASAMATARHTGHQAHTAITVPMLCQAEITALLESSTTCGHATRLRAGELSDCLADPAHCAGTELAPAAQHIGFACTCGTPPCHHSAALAHAVTHRLRTTPAAFAALRGLLPLPQVHAAPADPDHCPTAATPPRISAQQAWDWYRNRPEAPALPAPGPFAEPEPHSAAWPPPPAPAPTADQLHALVRDAAAQARNHLLTGAPLQCALLEDALRLAEAIPLTPLPEVADRLGLDIADLRERLAAPPSAPAVCGPRGQRSDTGSERP
ncbi:MULTISPECIES: hypothetical protein [Streptacidiphilus]|uniref:SWIM-type domain-containing protein n=1 Tax=Streptacidiphilus cavernicola TaxID=3342716 RepID=A0ABV6UWB5_9ACTN|nr:hypothetical protein [Streptacidiphilus jeojiense]